MHKREDVYAVMKTPLFKATFKYANLLYGIGNYAYALKLLENKALDYVTSVLEAFSWIDSKEGFDYWCRIDKVQREEVLNNPL